MKYSQILSDAVQKLEAACIENASLDARLLLQFASGLSHADLIARSEEMLEPQLAVRFDEMISLRASHMPVGRILGTAEFYGREFGLNAGTLEPRADTETLIDIAKEIFKDKDEPINFVDIGTGSGAIALTLAIELMGIHGVAIDLSAVALQQAKLNAEALDINSVDFVHGNCLDPLNIEPYASCQYDLIVSNPPYIASLDIDGLAPEVRDHDPLLALDGGIDGLTFYKEIVLGAARYLKPDGYLLLEIGFDQEQALIELIEQAGDLEFISKHKDLSGHPRAILAKKH